VVHVYFGPQLEISRAGVSINSTAGRPSGCALPRILVLFTYKRTSVVEFGCVVLHRCTSPMNETMQGLLCVHCMCVVTLSRWPRCRLTCRGYRSSILKHIETLSAAHVITTLLQQQPPLMNSYHHHPIIIIIIMRELQ